MKLVFWGSVSLIRLSVSWRACSISGMFIIPLVPRRNEWSRGGWLHWLQAIRLLPLYRGGKEEPLEDCCAQELKNASSNDRILIWQCIHRMNWRGGGEKAWEDRTGKVQWWNLAFPLSEQPLAVSTVWQKDRVIDGSVVTKRNYSWIEWEKSFTFLLMASNIFLRDGELW